MLLFGVLGPFPGGVLGPFLLGASMCCAVLLGAVLW